MADPIHGPRKFAATMAALSLLFIGGDALASAMNPLGFYVGGGVGQTRSGIRNFDSFGFEGSDAPWDDHPTAWNAIIGIRPLSRFAVEAQYVDFGATSLHAQNADYTRARADALALYAVGFLPIPLPYLDLYGKIGMARVHSKADGQYGCESVATCALTFNDRHNDSAFSYGLGAQVKYQAAALRLEYLGASTYIGSPRAVLVELTWTF